MLVRVVAAPLWIPAECLGKHQKTACRFLDPCTQAMWKTQMKLLALARLSPNRYSSHLGSDQ